MASSLLACPFCRELYEASEAELCPVCGVVLRPIADLPPSYEMREQQAAEWERTAPQDRALPWHHIGANRGWVIATNLVGLATFLAPWLILTKPEDVALTGLQLTSSKGFWFGGGAAAWFVNIPLVASRRTINQLRSVRIIVTLFSGLCTCQALLLLLLSPTESMVPVEYHWGWGFYASASLGLIAAGFSAFLGHHPQANEDSERTSSVSELPVEPESGEERTLH